MVDGFLFSWVRVFYSNCDEGDFSLIVMRKGAFSTCDELEHTR